MKTFGEICAKIEMFIPKLFFELGRGIRFCKRCLVLIYFEQI